MGVRQHNFALEIDPLRAMIRNRSMPLHELSKNLTSTPNHQKASSLRGGSFSERRIPPARSSWEPTPIRNGVLHRVPKAINIITTQQSDALVAPLYAAGELI